MSSARTSAWVAGAFFIIAAVTAIVGLALYQPLLTDANYIVTRPGADAQIALGAFFEVILAISVVGTAVTLFPVVRRQNEAMALGYACGRTAEAVIIAVGIMSLLAIVRLRQEFAGASGASADSLVQIGKALVAIHDWTFLFGPNIALGVNTSLLASLMYGSALVPRPIAVLGLVGGPLIFVSGIAVVFGLYPQVSVLGSLAALPVFAWEMSLALWLILRGFRPSPVLKGAPIG